MKTSPHWIAFASYAAILVCAGTAARAFTDSNAETKEAAAERSVRMTITDKAAQPRRTVVYVPAAPKSLDGFKPVLPPERGEVLAKADARKVQSR